MTRNPVTGGTTLVLALPHQMRMLRATKPVVFFGGGVGSGKSFGGAVWALSQIARYPKSRGLIAANTYGQLRDATLTTLYRVLDQYHIPRFPPLLPRGGVRDIRIGAANIMCRSLDNYATLSGIEVGWAWIDEAWGADKEAVEIVQARLRGEGSRQLLLTTTTDEPTSYLHDLANRDNTAAIYAPSQANRHLPPEYLANLKAAYSPDLYRRMVLGEWIGLAEGRIYRSFTDENIDASVVFDPAYATIWAWDFNIGEGKPMSSCLLQIRKNSEVHVIDEIVIANGTIQDSIAEFRGRYPQPPANLIVTGDASARSKSHTGQSDNHSIATHGYDTDFPKVNPLCRDRHNHVNTLLCDMAGTRRLRIHPRCTTVIQGLRTTHLKPGSGYVEDDSNPAQHVTTALGYALCQYVPALSPAKPWQHPVLRHMR